MKKLIQLSIMLFAVITFAQESAPKVGSISGKVIDQTTQETLPYVSIIIKDFQGTVLTGGITNDEGQFDIDKIPAGEQTIEIQFIGYKTDVRKIVFSRQDPKHDLGTIALS